MLAFLLCYPATAFLLVLHGHYIFMRSQQMPPREHVCCFEHAPTVIALLHIDLRVQACLNSKSAIYGAHLNKSVPSILAYHEEHVPRQWDGASFTAHWRLRCGATPPVWGWPGGRSPRGRLRRQPRRLRQRRRPRRRQRRPRRPHDWPDHHHQQGALQVPHCVIVLNTTVLLLRSTHSSIHG